MCASYAMNLPDDEMLGGGNNGGGASPVGLHDHAIFAVGGRLAAAAVEV